MAAPLLTHSLYLALSAQGPSVPSDVSLLISQHGECNDMAASMTNSDRVAQAHDDCGALLKRIDDLLARAKLDPVLGPPILALRREGEAAYRAGRSSECREKLREVARRLGMRVD